MDTDTALLRFRQRITAAANALFGKPEVTPAPETSLSGFAAAADFLDDLTNAFKRPSPELSAVFTDMRDMDDSLDEVATALDHLSEDAMAPDPNQPLPFRVVFDKQDSGLDELVATLWQRLNIRSLLIPLAREALLMGNEYRQIGVNQDMLVTELMYLAPETVRVQTDDFGRLLSGEDAKPESKEGWAYIQIINESFKAGYYPWEVAHSRWSVRGGSLYGTPLYRTARWPWRKLIAMEDALVLNWLTRAFARLLFTLDVTGKSDKEALEYIRRFKQQLSTARVGAGKTSQSAISMVRDIYVGAGYHTIMGQAQPGLTDVKVLDTAGSAFTSVDPVEYYRGKIIMAGRVPRAYIGLEENINAKATLVAEDRKYAKTLQTIQMVVGMTLTSVLQVQMVLQNLVPSEHPFYIAWYNPSRADVVDLSLAESQYASAAERLIPMGVVDPEFVATKRLGISQAEWTNIIQRQAGERASVPEPKPEPVPDNGREREPVGVGQ